MILGSMRYRDCNAIMERTPCNLRYYISDAYKSKYAMHA